MKLFLIPFLLVGLAFEGIEFKIFVKKDGNFVGTCASASPFLIKNDKQCEFCVKLPSEFDCKNLEIK